MAKRMIAMLVVVIAFVAILGLYKYSQIKKAMSQDWSPPPEAVTTIAARQEAWNATLSAIGTVAAVNGVTVSADLPGVIEQISFNSGHAVGRGAVLVRLDSRQERAQLAAAEAARELTRLSLERKSGLLAKAAIPQAMYDQASAEYKQAVARVGEIRAMIDRKTIRAPFAGVLGIRQVNVGQYLAGGAPIVSLQAVRPAYVNFSVTQQDLGRMTIGSVIEATSDALGGATEVGRIAAIDSVIDEATRNARVQAIFENRSGKLRPGMFVEAKLAEGTKSSAITLPASAISYAPFGDSVFIVEQVKDPKSGKSYRGVRQQFVKLGGTRGDQVAVLTGVKAGEEVVTSGVFKLRPGAAVTVNNAVQPGNLAAPKPEDS
ncbi:MAG: efflux RND transporter periplasmic adaptor subunit [Acidobacteriota bacterium]